MEFKKLIISLLASASVFLIRPGLMADTAISLLCTKLNAESKYNITYGYVDMTRQGLSVRVYLALPYIVTGGSIYYMNTIPSINKKGEIELPGEYVAKISELFSASNSVLENISSSSISSASTNEKGDLGYKTNYNIMNEEKGFFPIDLVIIDPGHGGKDPGGIGSEGVKEKEIVLSVANMAGQFIKKDWNIPVVFTRKGDNYVSLKDRTEITSMLLKKGKNPIFVSIHGNISFNKNVKGLEVYSLSDRATDNEALAVEMVENAGYSRSDIEKTENLNFIITDLLKDSIRRNSEDLSKEIGYFISKSGLTELRGNKKANFYVLKYNSIPSVLIEIGYLSNTDEARNLINREYQKKIAREIARGINAFISKYNKTRGL